MKHDGRIAYKTICAAKSGDTVAIKEILRLYERYTSTFAGVSFMTRMGFPMRWWTKTGRNRLNPSISMPWSSTMIQNASPKGTLETE